MRMHLSTVLSAFSIQTQMKQFLKKRGKRSLMFHSQSSFPFLSDSLWYLSFPFLIQVSHSLSFLSFHTKKGKKIFCSYTRWDGWHSGTTTTGQREHTHSSITRLILLSSPLSRSYSALLLGKKELWLQKWKWKRFSFFYIWWFDWQQHLIRLTLRPEATIINYYHGDSILCGHSDDVEEAMGNPLVSLSLGCSAIFLVSETKEVLWETFSFSFLVFAIFLLNLFCCWILFF